MVIHAQHSTSTSESPLTEVQSASLAPAAISNATSRAFEALQQQQQQDLPFLNDGMHQPEKSLHRQWTDLCLQLQQALRARIPDPQSLLALLATLQRADAQAAEGAQEAGIAAESAVDESLSAASEMPDQLPGSIAGLTQSSGGGTDVEGAVTASQLTGTAVLKLLTAYQQCLPDAISDSHIDILSLMPQVSFDGLILRVRACYASGIASCSKVVRHHQERGD